jgi:chemotaxis protein histidine kinase CheA
MKKKLEAELISIAHRILKLKNKSEIDQLYLETQKLYEKLSVLKFVEENFADVKPTIGKAGAEEILETAFDKNEKTEQVPSDEKAAAPIKDEVSAELPEKEEKPEEKPEDNDPEEEEKEAEKIQEPEQPETEKLEEVRPNEQALETPEEKETDELVAEAEVSAETEGSSPAEDTSVPQAGIDFEEPETIEEIAAAMPEEAKDNGLFKPAFEWAFEAKSDNKQEENKPSIEEAPKSQSGQIAFEDLLGAGYKDPVFVKPGDVSPTTESFKDTDIPAEDNRIEPKEVIPITRRDDKVPVFKMNSETLSLNDRISKGITVGLNDRIAFVKNLFNNSNEDYNRVLSQLITFDTYADAVDFIDNMVKPDYNNWDGKDEYAQRFMEIIERKFS